MGPFSIDDVRWMAEGDLGLAQNPGESDRHSANASLPLTTRPRAGRHPCSSGSSAARTCQKSPSVISSVRIRA